MGGSCGPLQAHLANDHAKPRRPPRALPAGGEGGTQGYSCRPVDGPHWAPPVHYMAQGRVRARCGVPKPWARHRLLWCARLPFSTYTTYGRGLRTPPGHSMPCLPLLDWHRWSSRRGGVRVWPLPDGRLIGRLRWPIGPSPIPCMLRLSLWFVTRGPALGIGGQRGWCSWPFSRASMSTPWPASWSVLALPFILPLAGGSVSSGQFGHGRPLLSRLLWTQTGRIV